jgi:hypothetical protein
MHCDGLVAEGEQLYEMCTRTELYKYVILLFYYTGCFKKFSYIYIACLTYRDDDQKLTMNVGWQIASE